jgi:flagellar motor switch protein FliG
MPVDNPIQNAAALLLMLDPTEAQGILAHLRPQELAQMRLAIAAIDSRHAVLQPQAVAQVGAQQTTPPAVRSRLLGGPGHYVQTLLEQAFGRSFAEGALPPTNQRVDQPSGGSTSIAIDADAQRGRGLDRLRTTDTTNAVQVIAAEHPQAAAAVLVATGPDFAARILQLIPPRQRAELILRVARTGHISADALDDLDASLHWALDALAARKGRVQGGIPMAAQVLERLGRPHDVAVMEYLKAADPDSAARIERRRDGGVSVSPGVSAFGADQDASHGGVQTGPVVSAAEMDAILLGLGHIQTRDDALAVTDGTVFGALPPANVSALNWHSLPHIVRGELPGWDALMADVCADFASTLGRWLGMPVVLRAQAATVASTRETAIGGLVGRDAQQPVAASFVHVLGWTPCGNARLPSVLVLERSLLELAVERHFGGAAAPNASAVSAQAVLPPAAARVLHRWAQGLADAVTSAWPVESPVAAPVWTIEAAESNTQQPWWSDCLQPAGPWVRTCVDVEMAGLQGRLEWTLPWAVLESARLLWRSHVADGRGAASSQWSPRLQTLLADVAMPLRALAAAPKHSLRQLANWSVGDCLLLDTEVAVKAGAGSFERESVGLTLLQAALVAEQPPRLRVHRNWTHVPGGIA